IALIGAAGLGKSRLIRDTNRRFEDLQNSLWLEAAAASFAVSNPYFLYRNLILHWLTVDLSASKSDVFAAIDARAGTLQPQARQALETLTPILIGDIIEGVDPDVANDLVFQAVRDLLDSLGSTGPLAIALEDLHWSDPSSLALTESIVGLAHVRPIMLII